MGVLDDEAQHASNQRPAPLGPDSIARPLAELDEPTLLALYKTGTPAEANLVLSEFYRRYADLVWQQARLKNYVLEDAQNVAGQTWLEVRVKLVQYEWQGQRLGAWLRRIVDNLSKRANAAQALTERFPGDDPQVAAEQVPDARATVARDFGPEAAAADPARSDVARFVFQIRPHLKRTDRRLFYLSYFRRLDAPRLAERLGKTPAAMRQANRRLRQRLGKLAVAYQFHLPAHWRILGKES